MGGYRFSLVVATLVCFCFAVIASQGQGRKRGFHNTSFSCVGRTSGYYADVETGCQVYHMCDGLGRQFSYTCPNTTLFQQRMLICDHWYMVNCSKSESDYSANLLIGQRDKPFVSEADMQQRTPRPDILSVPPNGNYYDGLKESETKYPGNSIVGIVDTISTNNGLDSAKQNYRPPSSWSMGIGERPKTPNRPRPTPNIQTNLPEEDNLTGAASQRPSLAFESTPSDRFTQNTGFPVTSTDNDDRTSVSRSTTEAVSSEEFHLDVRMKDKEDPVVTFIKRFDPNSPDSIKTSMTKSEILNINQQLPDAQVSSEEDRTPRKNKDNGNTANRIAGDRTKGFTESSRFDSVNVKPTEPTDTFKPSIPNKELLPPKSETSDPPSTTIGPPIYYEWKWAVPAFDLEPPKADNLTINATAITALPQSRNAGRSPFSSVTRPTPVEDEVRAPERNSEYNISSYFIPDYVFPLDKPHPGYSNDDAETSFNVKVARPGRASYGENPACPQCHPAYVVPGTCEPCVVKR
ncbi:jiangshi isoform X1 [Choristoneura fumiferana]|uniref:jiangshi isoform X1 n=1 Tax=Choristoneura fumiferana TaxID=7141 RepID=UPI003D15BC26